MRALLVVSAAVPLALFAGISWYLHGERLEHGAEQIRQTTMVLEEHALRVFEAQQLIIDRVDQRIAEMSWDEIRESKAVHQFIRKAADSSPHIDGIWLIPPGGRTANSADFFPMLPVDASDRDYYRALEQRDQLFFGEMIVGKTKGTLNFNLSRRRSPRDSFDGLVLVTSSLDYVISFWDKVSPYRRHVVALVRPDGEVLARYPRVEGLPDRLLPKSPLMAAVADAESGILAAPSNVDGTERIYGYSRIGDYPLYISFGVARSDVLAPWRADLVQHGIIALSASALLFGISLLALRQNRRLATAMASWRETANRLSAEVDRREKAEDLAAEKQRLLSELGAANAQRRAILDSMLEGVVAYGPDGKVIYCNDASRRILGLPEGALPALDALARGGGVRSLDGAALDEQAAPVARLLRGETLAQEDLRLSPACDGARRLVCRFSGAPLADGGGRIVGGVLTFADVTEEKANEERRALLTNELDHRVRNMLATIIAMVRLSSQGAAGKAELVETLTGRIGAMTRTHNLLTQNSWRGALLRDVLADEVRPYATPGRITLPSEEPIVLPPQDAVDFALVVHELATNAAKYGAWSGAEGGVEVSWSREASDPPRLRVLWREHGGPPVEHPTRLGFGSTLIRNAFRGEGAGVELRYEPGGVTCEIRLPLRDGPGWRPLAPAESTTVPPRPPQTLEGLAVLLVEDEPIVRLELAGVLEDAGARVLGPMASVSEGLLAIADQRPGAAVLDVNVRGENVSPLAEALVARGVPVVFVSGYRDLELLSPKLRQLPLVQKPLRPGELVAALAALAAATTAESAVG